MLPIRWSLISEHFSLLSPGSHFLHHAEHHHRVYHFCSRLYLAVTGHSVQQWLLPLHPGHLLPVCVVHVQPDAGTRLWQTLHKPGEDRSVQYRSSFRPVRFYQPLHRHFLLFRCQLGVPARFIEPFGIWVSPDGNGPANRRTPTDPHHSSLSHVFFGHHPAVRPYFR